jgi:hypothetical protein
MWQVSGGRRHIYWRRPLWIASDPAVKGGRRQDLWRRPPGTCHIGCHVGKVGANGTGVVVRYLGANDDGAEVGSIFLNETAKGIVVQKKPKKAKIQKSWLRVRPHRAPKNIGPPSH